ncbi:Ig-like domain-containing protein [Capnocytophaga granulosa]|uniref:Ig-like domain-containing protein n=1 Tax=Capnocytophaga granulosa TaxID=45242 RepID=UPI00385761C1
MAEPISGGSNIYISNILIKKDTETPQYSLSQIPKVCGSTKVGIRVDVSSAVYPVYYTLQNHLGVDIAGKVKQTSNIFDGLDPGTYNVKVENFCGAYITPKPITLTNAELTFTHLYSTPQNLSNKTENPIAKEFGCDYVEFQNLMLYGTNLTEANNSNSFPYPMVVKFTITAPDGDKYYPTYTINNKSDLDTYIGKYDYGEALSVNNNLREYRIPKYKEVAGVKHYRYGVWKVGAEITTSCGGTQVLSEVTTHLHNPIENAELELNNEGNSPDACHKVQLRIKSKYRSDTSPKLNTYLVIDAPATFKYAEAGFYQITTTNPLLQGKYLKQIQYSPEYHTTILTPEFLKNGETYQFSLVDAECDTSRIQTFPPITISTPSTQVATKIQVFEVASCKDVTTTEAPYGSLKIIKEAGSAIKEVKIIKYTDTNGIVYTSGAIPGGVLTLPYTLTDSNRVSDTKWYVRDLPKGTYEVAATNICNVVTLAPPRQIEGQDYSTVHFSEGCLPKVEGKIMHEQPFNGDDQESNFAIQRFNPATQNWEEHLRAGLGRRTELNATTADEGLGNEGKFRIVRRVFNSERSAYECETVIAEKEFKGDLKEPKIVGFRCNGGATRHVMVIPQGGIGPYIYKLVHKLPAGSTVPDTSVSQTQAGNNFFLNLDGSNNSIAYKFSVTDACPSSKESEITVLNILPPKIEANQKYFCEGQSATLTIANLGPDVIIEWYNTDNPSVTLATGTTYTIPSLTTADFGTYKVRLKIPSHTDIQSCVENAVAPFTIAKKDVVLPTIPPSNSSVEKCLEQNEDFNIASLFTGIPSSLPEGATDRIIEASGVVQIYNNKTLPNGNPDPKYRTIPLRLQGAYQKPKGIGSFTFYYQILSPCGEVKQQQEVKLTVRLSPKYIPKPIIKICKANITLDEIKQEVIKGTPEIAALQPVFKWYSSLPNAQAKTSEQPGTTSLDMDNGPYTYSVRLSHPNYCDRIYPIKIERETTFAAKTLTNDGCAVTNIASLKALVDPDDAVNVLIYKDGVQQADDAIVEGNTGYTYAKKNAYNCPISPAPLNFVFTPRVQAKNEKVKICAYIGYYGGLLTTVKEIKDALKEKYPSVTAIRIWYQDNNGLWHERTDDNEGTSINTNYRFMFKQTGMCDSVIYSLRLELNEQTSVAAQTITICDQITVRELIAKLQTDFGYSNVKIHQGRGTENMSDDTFVDWNNSIYFSAQETGKCRSIKETLNIQKSTNVTQADSKTFEVCKAVGQQPKVSDLKAVVGNDARIFVRDNSNRWVLQGDNDNVYEANSYFYTIEEAVKCPSEKTALVVRITRKTPTPTAPADPKWCSGKKVSDLKTYITSKGVVGTIRIYESATATTELADNIALENNKPYHFTAQDPDPQRCESDRRSLTVTVYANPAITTQPAASSTPCKGDAVSLSVVATGDGNLTYQWFSNTVDNNTGGTAIANTNDRTFTPSTDTAGETKYYYVKVTSDTGCTAAVSNTAKVVVKQPTAITTHPVDAPLYCMGDTPYPGPLSVAATGEGTLAYQWYASFSNSYSGTAIPGETGTQYTYPINQEGVTYYYVEVTGECGTIKSDIAGVGIKQYARFKSDGNLTASDNATYCKDATTVSKLTVRTEGSVNPLYQWYKAPDATSPGVAINNAWSNEYTPDVSQPGTYYYYVEVKTTGCPGIATSARAKIVVTKPTAITTNLSTAEVSYCKDHTAPAALSVTAEGTGTLTYKWYEAPDATSPGTVIAGQTTNSYTSLVTTVSTKYYYVVVHSDCGTDVTSARAHITVTGPTAIDTNLSTTEKKYCKDQSAGVLDLLIKAKGTAPFTYKWYKAANATATGTLIRTENTNSDEDSYTPVVTTVGTAYYYVEVRSACGSDVTSARAQITVTEPTAIDTDLSTAEVKYCKDDTSVSPLLIKAKGTAPYTYKWYKADNTTDAGQEVRTQTNSNSNEDSYTPVVTTVGTAYYYVKITGHCGAEVTSDRTKITVTKDTAIKTDGNLSTTEVKYCKNTTATALTVKVEGTAPYTYKWYKADNATDAGQEVRTQTNSNSNEDSYTPVVTTAGTAYYYVKITGHCGAEVTSDRTKITVTKDTAIKTDGNLSTTEVKYCKNTTATALTVKVEGTAPYTYKWYKADSATATGTLIRTENTNSDEDSYTPVVTTVGTAYYYVEVSSACGSEETSARAYITVQDITVQPTLTAVNLCQGATVADLKAQLALTLTGTLKVYATATDPADLADATLLNATTYYYTATETNKCESDRQAMAVTLVQAPTLQATYTYCVGTTVDTLWKAIDANDSDNSIRIYNVATGGTPLTHTDLLSTTTYYVAETASNGGVVTCETSRVATQVTIGSVANPIIATRPATCGQATVVKITNHVPGINYTITDSANATVAGASVAADGTIGGITSAGTYKIKATQDTCVSGEETFTIAEALPVPETPTVMVTRPTCTVISAAKVSNYTDYTHGETFAITDSNGTAIGAVDSAGNITGLTTAGTYTLTITRGTCRAAAVDFDIAGKLPTPAKPTITLTPASCTSPTVAKLTQVSELTFWHNGTQLTVNPITHEITGLAPGTYTVTAKNNNNCESVASDRFEIKAQQTATTITTAPAGATYQKGAETTPLAVVATGEGTLSYKWYKNTDNNNTSGTEVGDNSPSYKPATDRVGTFYYWVEVTSNCGAKKSTVAEIKVVEGAPTIEANDDPDTTVRRGQEVAVLGNDKVNGNPATPADVDITISNDDGLTRVGVNPATGKIMIPNDAAPATYEITYKICVKNQPTICDEAKVKITVEVPVRALKAVDDDFGKIPNAVDYTTTNTVFSTGVDTMEGVVGNLSPERDVVMTPGAQPHENITMNPNGSITVKRGTPKGTYTYEYTICQKDVPTNCDKAKVSFEVIEAHIFAKDDGVWEVGTEGALTPSILNNDILGERVAIAPSEVTITKTNGKPVIDDTKMVMNEDGRISVKKGIAEGPYTYYYTITEKANPSNTSSAKVTIRVVSFSAQDDEFNITNDKTKEFKTESVLANDELNKKKNPSPVDDVILTKGEAKDAERNPTNALTMNEDGTITIAPNTPDGVYTYTYTICKKSPPTECKSAEAVIKLLPALIANDDDFTANPINPLVKEGIAGNVLDNDRYADGNALEHLDKVKITMLEGQESRANIEPNGNVVIPQGAPAGEYTLKYNLCMKDHPTICAEAKVKIVILEDKPIVIHNGISANGDGVNDGFMIEHIEGYPKNNLKIFNRWGVLVYEKDGYTNSEPFDGYSNGRATISADSKLPQGTYYYILEYQDTAEQTHTKKGWLYLKY